MTQWPKCGRRLISAAIMPPEHLQKAPQSKAQAKQWPVDALAKAATGLPKNADALPIPEEGSDDAPKPKRKRTRSRKKKTPTNDTLSREQVSEPTKPAAAKTPDNS